MKDNNKELQISNMLSKEIKKSYKNIKPVKERRNLTRLIHEELNKYFIIFNGGYYDEGDLISFINSIIEILKSDGEDTKYHKSIKKRIVEGDFNLAQEFQIWLNGLGGYIDESDDFIEQFASFLESKKGEIK